MVTKAKWTAAVVTIGVLLFACPIAAFLVHAVVYQNVTAPVQRQNLNHDPDWLRGKTAEVTNLYHDFQNAQQSETADKVLIAAYIKDHGDPSTWPAYSPVAQVFQQMETKAQGDYQAEVTDAQLYNADRENPDLAPVWAQAALADYPQSLTPDAVAP